jgi:hypothetical protein
MHQKATHFIYGTVLTFCLLLACLSAASAQTIYEESPGYSAGLKTLLIGGGSFETTFHFGPSIGYRFNNNFDLSFHPELLYSSNIFTGGIDRTLTLLNFGILAGYTARLTKPLMIRTELSLYNSFNLKTEEFGNNPKPSLSSALASSSLYARLPVTNTISLLPNIGAFLGYGEYVSPNSRAELAQGFDGFVAGPELGLRLLFVLSDSFSMTLTPSYRHNLSKNAQFNEEFSGSLKFNF